MKIASAAMASALVVACGSLWHGDQQSSEPCPEKTDGGMCEEAVERVTLKFQRCERQRIQLIESPPIVKHVTKVVEKPGPPKVCADHPPTMVPVKTVECAPGFLCVDAKSQRAWLQNELAMRRWASDVMECERSP